MNERRNRFFKKITNSAAALTPTEKNIADHLMQTYPNCLLKNASELAREISVNVSTMTRFFQKIGYKNIREAQCEFRDDISFQLSSPMERFDTKTTLDSENEILRAAMGNDLNNIEKTYKDLSLTDVYKVTDMLSDISGKVYIGSDKSRSYALAYYLYSQLRIIRPGVKLLESNQINLASDMAEIDQNAVLLICDFRPYIKLNQEIVRIFNKYEARVVVITDSPISPIGEMADVAFTIPTKSLSPFESYLAGFALVDLIANILSKDCMGYIKNNYKKIEKMCSDFDIFF